MKRSWPEASTPWSSKIALTRESTETWAKMSATASASRFCWNWRWMISPLCSRSSFSVTPASCLTWSETASAWSESSSWAMLILSGRTSRLARSRDVVDQHADRADRVAQADVAQALELLADGLDAAERDEGPQHVVGPLEDREDPDVADDLLPGLRPQVALAARELQ